MNETVRFSGGDILLGAQVLSAPDAEWLKGICAEEWRAAVANGHDRAVRRRHARRLAELAGALAARERWVRSSGGGQ